MHPCNPKLVLPSTPQRLAVPLNSSVLLAGLALCTALLAACGGGGGGGSTAFAPGPVVSAIPPSTQFKGTLVNLAPGAGALASDWSAATCTDNRQKNWVRSFLNENYLFYREAPLISIDPNTYTGTVANLFAAYTTGGVPAKDTFSFVLTQADADATFQSGTSSNVGFTLRRDNNNGGIIRIAYVDPAGPGAAAGFARGMVLASVDGTNTAFSIPQALFDKLFNSAPGTSSVVGVQDTINGPVRNITVASANYSSSPLLIERIFPGTNITPTAGYLAYTSFATPIGEVQLADAFRRFAAAGVTNLIVDLRYNGGGYIDIASELGYMAAGPGSTNGRIFETLVYNDKRTADNGSIGFTNAITNFFGNTARAGEPFASLNLSTVYVLTTGSTCSASEAFISGLRGIGVEVVMIGGTTCGKPYGFSQANNCTLSYFGLEFEGRNNRGEVVPVTGLAPTCGATDDFDHALGDPNERMLSFAFFHQFTHVCPAFQVTSPGSPALSADSATGSPLFLRNPNALNPDMEFMTRPADSIKLRRSDK